MMAEEGQDKPLKPGDVFDGRFTIRKRLGSGNFSDVYHAEQTVCGVRLRDVALKVFKQQVTSANVREVLADAITLCRLAEECPSPEVDRHLVHILDGGLGRDPEDRERAYLTMELIAGGELTGVIRKHSGLPGIAGVPLELSLYYLDQMLAALAWMHSRDPAAVHGDLHPGNVLVTEGGEVKIVDFGLAARLPGAVFGGAIDYQAPETLLKQPGTTRFDVYALGLIWYEMLTGHKPFRGERIEQLGLELSVLSQDVKALEKPGGDDRALAAKRAERDHKQDEYINAQVELRKKPPPPASEANSQLAEHLGLESILNRCLAYRPNERYYSAGQLRKAIGEYLAGEGKGLGEGIARPDADEQAQRQRIKLPAKTPEALLEQARQLAGRGQFDQALQEADKAVAKEPRALRGWLVKARIAAAAAAKAPGDTRKKRIDQAMGFIKKAQELSRDQQNPDILEALADVYEADGRSGTAANMRAMAADLKKQAARRRL